MKKTNKKKFFLIHPDVDSDKDIDDIINEVLVPNKKVVKTARQKNSIDERKAKKEFEENM
jgi:hypothetical protein